MSVLYKQFYNVQTKIKAKVPHVLGGRQKRMMNKIDGNMKS